MPDMTLVTRLIADSTAFTAGTDKARSSNDALKGSVNSIIGQLERQKTAFENAGRSTLDWIEADKKASNEVKEHARALMSQVAAMQQVANAQKAMTADSGRFSRLTQPDHFGRGLDRMSRQSEIDAERAKMEADRNERDPFLQGMARHRAANDPFARGLTDLEDQRRKREAADKAAAERDAKDPFLQRLASHRDRKADDPFQRGLRTMTDDSAKRQRDIDARKTAGKAGDQWRAEDEAAKRHADELRDHNNRIKRARLDEENEDRARLTAAREASNQMAQVRRQDRQNRADDINVRQQLDTKRGIVPSQHGGMSQGRKGQMIVEGGRAIEDFAAGSAYGGLKGGILAASNNISQMTSMMGPQGAAVGAVASTLAILGTTAASTYDGWAAKNAKIKFELSEQKTGLTNVLHELDKIKEMREFRLNLRPDIDIQSLTRQQDQHNIDRTAKMREVDARQAALQTFRERAGIPEGMTPDDIVAAQRSKLQRHQTNIVPDWAPNSGAPVLRNTAGGVAHAEAIDDETQREYREQTKALADARRDAANMTKQSTLLEQQRAQTERFAQAERRNSLAKAEQQIKKEFEEMQALRRGGRGPLTLREQITDQRGRANEQNAKEKSRFESGQEWMKNRGEELLLGNMKSDKDRAAYQAQKEHQQSLLQSAEAERMGVMTPEERASMDKQSETKRDKDIRQAKYGDLQADGQSGFGSQGAGTVGGMNAIVKAIRYSEQSKTIDELKRNGDISAEIAASLKAGIEVKNLTPATVVSF